MITAQDVYDSAAKARHALRRAYDPLQPTDVRYQLGLVLQSWLRVADEVRDGEDPTIAALRRELF